MSYQVFARKYRPRTFEDLLGQDHVVRTLRNAIEQNRIAQAYLFVGPRGTGKTSTARILAKALNCPGGPKVDFDPEDEVCREIAEGRSLDVLEIDGASNNSVDQVRELRETVKFAPNSGQFRIYYIDEVHMLSTAAFNALLKTLEEPPPHVKFIFATTEPHKVLPTIVSRCQRFDLRPISAAVIGRQLLAIAAEENIKLSEEAAQAIARGADGGMRDAQSMLDQLVAFCGEAIEEQDVLDVFGFASRQTIADLTGHILRGETVEALSLVHQQHEAGRDLGNLLSELVTFLRNVLVHVIDPEQSLPDSAGESRVHVEAVAHLADEDQLLELADCLADLQARMRWTPNKKLHVEMGIIKAVQILQHASLNDVISYLQNAAEGAEMPAVPIAGRAKGSGAASAAKPAPPAKVVQAATKEPVPAAEEKAAPAVDPVVEPPAEGAADAAEKQAGGRVSAGESAPPADAPKAENESPKASQGPVEAGELWSRCVDYLQEKGDGMAGLVASLGKVLSFDESSLRVGFPESREFELHSIVAPLRAKMEKFISDHLGKGVHLKMELSAEVEDEEEEFFDEPPSFENEEEELEPVEAREPAKGKAKPKAKTDKAAEPDEFYNDPLIEEAMRLFEARIAKE